MYTEMVFPNNDIRFIAINNGVDSANQMDNDMTPFINIFNEFYAKDTSKKVKTVFRAKGNSGKPADYQSALRLSERPQRQTPLDH